MWASDKDTYCDGLYGWLNIKAHDMLKRFSWRSTLLWPCSAHETPFTLKERGKYQVQLVAGWVPHYDGSITIANTVMRLPM